MYMSKTESENTLENLCSFCARKPFCEDFVMVKGINKLIKEVAPNLVLECTKYDSTLSSFKPMGPVTPLSAFVAKEVLS